MKQTILFLATGLFLFTCGTSQGQSGEQASAPVEKPVVESTASPARPNLPGTPVAPTPLQPAFEGVAPSLPALPSPPAPDAPKADLDQSSELLEITIEASTSQIVLDSIAKSLNNLGLKTEMRAQYIDGRIVSIEASMRKNGSLSTYASDDFGQVTIQLSRSATGKILSFGFDSQRGAQTQHWQSHTWTGLDADHRVPTGRKSIRRSRMHKRGIHRMKQMRKIRAKRVVRRMRTSGIRRSRV